jgi:hypothetical protein
MHFGVPAYWTPEQALAVIELLDDLSNLIRAHYGAQLLDAPTSRVRECQTTKSDAS